MTSCLHCNADTSNGLTLCQACQAAVATYLEFLPVYFRNLARQRRPARPNGSLGGIGQQWLLRRGETTGSDIETALARASTTIAKWVLELDTETPTGDTEADTFAAQCELLEHNIARIATTDHASQFVRDITRHEHTLRALTETVVPGWYAGACQQPAGRDLEGNTHICGVNTYVVPGLTWVTCRRCGATTHARDHIDVVLDEARDWIAPPMRLAEALVQLVDTEQSITRLYRRIKIWGHRGRIDRLRELNPQGDLVGPYRYRLGDVLDHLEREGPSVDVHHIYRERQARVTGLPAA